jgi:hypothetical protein
MALGGSSRLHRLHDLLNCEFPLSGLLEYSVNADQDLFTAGHLSYFSFPDALGFAG